MVYISPHRDVSDHLVNRPSRIRMLRCASRAAGGDVELMGAGCVQFIALYMKADLDNVTNVHAPEGHNWCLTVRVTGQHLHLAAHSLSSLSLPCDICLIGRSVLLYRTAPSHATRGSVTGYRGTGGHREHLT
jgi:hypothetical protein